MKINLASGSKSSEGQQKIVYWLAAEMAKEYNIGSAAVMYFINEGHGDFCKWIKKLIMSMLADFYSKTAYKHMGPDLILKIVHN